VWIIAFIVPEELPKMAMVLIVEKTIHGFDPGSLSSLPA
jgi:hypothetical protein